MPLILILAIPLILNVLAVARWRHWPRFAAIVPFVALSPALAIDGYSASQKGNLTGLFTMIAAPPAMVALLVLWMLEALQRAVDRREREEAG